MADKDGSGTISEKVIKISIIQLIFQVDLCLGTDKFDYDRRQLVSYIIEINS